MTPPTYNDKQEQCETFEVTRLCIILNNNKVPRNTRYSIKKKKLNLLSLCLDFKNTSFTECNNEKVFNPS